MYRSLLRLVGSRQAPGTLTRHSCWAQLEPSNAPNTDAKLNHSQRDRGRLCPCEETRIGANTLKMPDPLNSTRVASTNTQETRCSQSKTRSLCRSSSQAEVVMFNGVPRYSNTGAVQIVLHDCRKSVGCLRREPFDCSRVDVVTRFLGTWQALAAPIYSEYSTARLPHRSLDRS